MRIRIFVSLIALLLTATLYAQTNEIGIFVNQSALSSSSETDPAIPITGKVKFDSKSGYGISFDRFINPGLAVQLSGQTVRAKARISASTAGVSLGESAGTLDLKQYDAALHWYLAPNRSFRPYVGTGIAWIGSGKLKTAAEPAAGIEAGSVGLRNKLTWLVDGGVDFSVSQRSAITLAAKYTHYTAKLETTPDDLFQSLKLDPLTLALGIRFKF